MNRLALFNQDELALAFSLVLPDDAARALAQEWFAHFAAVEDVNDEGYFLAPEDAEDVAMDEEPAILASSESAASSSEVEYINLQGMPIEEKRRWLLSFSDLHLGLLALSSPQLSDRVRRYLRDSDEAAARRHRHMERIVRALNTQIRTIGSSGNYDHDENRRYYEATAPFTQQDPIGLAGGLNLYGFANGDPVNFADPFGLNPIGKLIKLGVRGSKTVMRNLDERALVRAAAENEDVVVSGGRQAASRVARQAGDGRRPVHHSAHRSAGEGARPHYHPDGRAGHVFYSAASALTVSHYVSEDAPGAVKAGAALLDFINPLSLAKDALDIVADVKEMTSSRDP